MALVPTMRFSTNSATAPTFNKICTPSGFSVYGITVEGKSQSLRGACVCETNRTVGRTNRGVSHTPARAGPEYSYIAFALDSRTSCGEPTAMPLNTGRKIQVSYSSARNGSPFNSFRKTAVDTDAGRVTTRLLGAADRGR